MNFTAVTLVASKCATTKYTNLERRPSRQHSRLNSEEMTGELLSRPAVKACGRQKRKEEVVFLLVNVFNQLCVMHAQSLALCPALWGSVDCSLPGSSCPWHSLDKNTAVGCHFLLQGILPTQGSNPCVLCLLHYRRSLPSHLWSPSSSFTSCTNLHVSISNSTSTKSERNLQRSKKKWLISMISCREQWGE